jgi:hypothetical protein
MNAILDTATVADTATSSQAKELDVYEKLAQIMEAHRRRSRELVAELGPKIGDLVDAAFREAGSTAAQIASLYTSIKFHNIRNGMPYDPVYPVISRSGNRVQIRWIVRRGFSRRRKFGRAIKKGRRAKFDTKKIHAETPQLMWPIVDACEVAFAEIRTNLRLYTLLRQSVRLRLKQIKVRLA